MVKITESFTYVVSDEDYTSIKKCIDTITNNGFDVFTYTNGELPENIEYSILKSNYTPNIHCIYEQKQG